MVENTTKITDSIETKQRDTGLPADRCRVCREKLVGFPCKCRMRESQYPKGHHWYWCVSHGFNKAENTTTRILAETHNNPRAV